MVILNLSMASKRKLNFDEDEEDEQSSVDCIKN